MPQTHRLGLPLLAPGQAQKDITHNEALLLIDIIGQTIAQSADLLTPPADPALGACWIVPPSATGAWSDNIHSIAGWTSNGWRFMAPQPGWRCWVIDRNHAMRFDGSGWIDAAARAEGYVVAGQQVLAHRQPAIPDPTGGATSDGEARTAILAILTALRAHGLIAI
jgi:hypothetical protein